MIQLDFRTSSTRISECKVAATLIHIRKIIIADGSLKNERLRMTANDSEW